MRTLALATLVLVFAAFATLGATTSPPNLGKALDQQRMLAKERPQDPEILNDLGNLLVLAGNLTEARSSYEAALVIDPALSSAHYNLGLLLQQQGERRKALGEFKQVLKSQPENAWAHFQAATLYEATGSESAAVEHYSEAFRLNPQLSFSEVNPQVIDSKLVTRSLLLAHRENPSSSGAPRDYAQPSRIVKLMVAPRAPAAETVASDALPDAAAAPAAAGRTPRAQIDNSDEPSAGRTLRPEDLEAERGGVRSSDQNSVRRGGSRVTTAPPASPSGNFTRPRIAPGVQPGPPSDPPRYTPPPVPSEESQEYGYDVDPRTLDVPGVQGVPGVAPQSGGQPQRFIPGIQSSGRLEMKLVPDAPAKGEAARGLAP